MNWILYGIGGALSFAGMTLLLKKIFQLGMPPLVALFYLFIFTTLGYAAYVPMKMSVKITGWAIPLLLLATAVCSLVGNYLDLMSVKLSPNPGYASALKATQIILITLLAPILLGADFTPGKFFGVALVFFGAVIITIF